MTDTPTTTSLEAAEAEQARQQALVAGNVRAELARAETDRKDVRTWLGGMSADGLHRRIRGTTRWRDPELVVLAEHLGVDLARLTDPPTK